MATSLEKLKAELQSKYGDLSAMSPDDMVEKGTISTGSLGIDYMCSSKHGFGIPRNIVIEVAGQPGAGKSTLSLNLINNSLNLEFERAKKYVRLEKAISDGKLESYEMDWFKKFWNKQQYDLHVFGEQEKNDILDNYELNDKDIDHAIDDVMRNAFYADIEGRFDKVWASKFIDKTWLDRKLLVAWPDTIENATTMYVDAVRNGNVAVAVIDSIGGAPTQRVFWKEAESGNVGGNALGVTRFSQFAENMASKYTCLTIGLNQVREDMSGYNQLVTPGGMAWKHAVSLRIELKRKKKEIVYDLEPGTSDSWYQVGFKVAARLHKNSIGPSGREASVWFYTETTDKYGQAGFDVIQDLFNLSVLTGKIEKGASGVYHSEMFPNGRIRGYDKTLEFIKDNEDIRKSLQEYVTQKLVNHEVEGYISDINDSDTEEKED